MKFSFPGTAILSAALVLSGCAIGKPDYVAQDPDQRNQEEQCYQEFSALKKLDPEAYKIYQAQFNTINANFALYKSNEPLIDENASEVMLTEIKKKLSLVCVRVNNAVYSNMAGRANSLSKL